MQKLRGWRAVSANDARLGTWAIEERSSGRVAGSVLLKGVEDRPGEIEVGWYLHPDSTGRGLATEAAAGAIAKAFADGAADVFAFTQTTNLPSGRVALAAGMDDVGVVRDRGYPGETQLFRSRRRG